MSVFFNKFSFRKLLFYPLMLALCATLCLFSACKKTVDYFDYVSELRNNIFLCSTDDFSLRIYATQKESPYCSDGIPCEISPRAEIYLIAPSGVENYQISFTLDGISYGGELSFDNVKTEYYYFCSLDISELKQIECTLTWGKESVVLCARSVLDENTLSAQTVLQNLLSSEQALFESMTDEYGFAGEIYVRLIYEDAPYYYIGVMDRNGGTNAFLASAQTGKILARRQS